MTCAYKIPLTIEFHRVSVVEFDNEEDCRMYDEEVSRREIEREEQKEEEQWIEEYDRRRHNLYYRNDSDYD